MGQQRSPVCPICEAENGGKWACHRCAPIITVYREALRNLQPWLSAVQDGDVPDTLDAGGTALCVWDVTRLFDARVRLAPQQANAIELFLYGNLTEREASKAMNVSSTVPVGIYATVGITRLLGMSYRGEIEGFRVELPDTEKEH